MSQILAVVTLTKERIGGGAPIFVVDKEDELERVSFTLEKILDANAHDLKNGTMILVKHT
ncbi:MULTISPECIES: capping complex subunit for YIEGIA [unclassified Paenibacillus]|uniref:capping complex subunit for YIEGIA n=1 Tax=unclassified Paenibacillus TaxID=185978 RepID=UPI00070B7018|nr:MULTISPECIES: hypothetical protein [unclassified Paenibacillus]KQX68775.1 hypothetical protein ASD40_23165 [Paenibacillus sp. Root444D2]KRE32437.1 hypothetical protein ASG85_17315 [Paenibacillus sp. Soil724D2]